MPNRIKKYADKELARKTRNAQRKRYYNKTVPLTAKHRRPKWTKQEVDLLWHYSRIYSDRYISQQIGRSVEAIQVMRCKLKKL